MTPAGLVAFALFVAGAALFLIQLWWQAWSPDLFLKLAATDGVLFAVALVSAFLVRERRADDALASRHKELD